MNPENKKFSIEQYKWMFETITNISFDSFIKDSIDEFVEEKKKQEKLEFEKNAELFD